MGGFNPPVPQQDNNWEIRVAVLLSLLFQVLILVLGPMRKRFSSPVAHFAIWSCYLLADWVADLALGLLLNNMGNIGGNNNGSGSSSTISHASGFKRAPGGAPANAAACESSSSPVIFAFWTPFLLLHLGGQDSMTAYSIEDNDLWRRHLIGLLFELFSAFVVFFCSLEGNPMIPATVLIFVVGIIKYGERTYSLYSGSIDGALAGIFGDGDPGPNYARFTSMLRGNERAGLPVQMVIMNPRSVEQVNTKIQPSLETQAYYFFRIFRRLCFDVKLSHKERKISKTYFLERAGVTSKAFEVIEVELNFIYDMVHTKEPIAHTKVGCVIRFIGSSCIVSALLIFFFHHKTGLARVDIAITYMLLLGGVALDAAALAMLLISNWTIAFLELKETPLMAWIARLIWQWRPRQQRWRGDTSQLNLISYCVGNPDIARFGRSLRPVMRTLTKVVERLHIKEMFHDLFFIHRVPLSSTSNTTDQGDDLFEVVFEMLKKRAMEADADMMKHTSNQQIMERLNSIYDDSHVARELVKVLVDMMKNTSNHRGQGVFQGDELHKQIMERLNSTYDDSHVVRELVKVLVDSVTEIEFAESLLIWHIATDLCCHTLPELTAQTHKTVGMKSASRTLSEYMVYLLMKQPKILLASAGIALKRYQDTCAEVKRFINLSAAWNPNHDDVVRMLLSVDTSLKPLEVKGDRSKSVLFDAVILAKVLRDLGEDLMWEVVAKVWGEMLTYAAGKCKGSTHVQQLSRGGELITMVWFLMAHLGLDDVYKNEPDVELVPKLIVHN